MGRPNLGGHIRTLGGKTHYRLIRVMTESGSKQVLEHRHLMEMHLGRKLERWEIVHHKDGNGLNNSIENLEIMIQADHQREHLMIGPKWPLDEAIQLRNEGWTLAAIADKYGVSWSSIRKAFSIRGISTCDKRHNSTKWDLEKAKTMFEEGHSLAEIARQSGVSPPSVFKAFKKYGVIQKDSKGKWISASSGNAS